MAVLPKAMCKLKSIPNKTATLFFTEMGKKTIKLIWKHKDPRWPNNLDQKE